MSTALKEGLVLTSRAGAFDELRLDMEVKGSARFELIIDPDAADPTNGSGRHVYTLYSGTDIPPEASAEFQYTQRDVNNDGIKETRNKFACKGGSDSGPDSDINDNCQ